MNMKKEKIFWGLLFIVGAIFLIVGKLGILGDISVVTILLGVFLLACLIKSILHKSVGGALFSIAFLCIVFSKQLGIEMLTPWPVLGAALLGTIGSSFIYHPKRSYYGGHLVDGHETIETVDDAQMDFHTTFGSSIKYVHSEDFQSAKLRCSFGAMKVYFDNAKMQGKEAVIELDVSFGGMELYIPREWKVLDGVGASFGAVEEKNSRINTPGEHVVKLVGKVSFAGVEIVYI